MNFGFQTIAAEGKLRSLDITLLWNNPRKGFFINLSYTRVIKTNISQTRIGDLTFPHTGRIGEKLRDKVVTSVCKCWWLISTAAAASATKAPFDLLHVAFTIRLLVLQYPSLKKRGHREKNRDFEKNLYDTVCFLILALYYTWCMRFMHHWPRMIIIDP